MFKKRYFTLEAVVENTRNAQDSPYRRGGVIGQQQLVAPMPAWVSLWKIYGRYSTGPFRQRHRIR
jgi:hypothetical protein